MTTESIGYVMYWHCPQGIFRNSEYAMEVASAEGFGKSEFPVPSPQASVSRTVQTFREQSRKDGRALQEVVKNDPQSKVWGILGLRNDGNEASYEQDTTVTFNKGDKSVTATGVQAEEFFRRYDKYRDCITDDDIRTFINRVRVLARGINLREGSGGVYFVPANYQSIVESAQKVLEQLKTKAKIYLLPMNNTRSNREAVWDSVSREVASEVESVLANAENLTRNISSFAKKEDQIAELGNLMAVYHQLLGFEEDYEEMQGHLQTASMKIAEMMSELTVAKSNVAAKRTTQREEKLAEEIDKVLECNHYTKFNIKDLVQKLQVRGFQAEGKTPLYAQVYNLCNCKYKKVSRGVYLVA